MYKATLFLLTLYVALGKVGVVRYGKNLRRHARYQPRHAHWAPATRNYVLR